MANSILMYGQDRVLLETRRMVLESHGYRVVAVNDLCAIPSGSIAHFDLLILCHSVAQVECELVQEIAALRWPSIGSLLLQTGADGCTGLPGRAFDSMDGPDKLLAVVHAEVERPHSMRHAGQV